MRTNQLPRASRGRKPARLADLEALEGRTLLSGAPLPVTALPPAAAPLASMRAQVDGPPQPQQMTNVGGTLYFWAHVAGSNTSGLFKSDGTGVGTVFLAHVLEPMSTCDLNGTLMFLASDDSGQNIDLWRSDGTTAGTGIVKQIVHHIFGLPDRYDLINVNGTLYIVGVDAVHGAEVWKSDGTAAGTVMVTDLSSQPRYAIFDSAPFGLTNVNGRLFFFTSYTTLTPVPGLEQPYYQSWLSVWTTDGTAAGTTQASTIEISTGHDVRPVDDLVALGNRLIWIVGGHLWSSDGTVSGTAQLALPTGVGGLYHLTSAGGTIYFLASSDTSTWMSNELWQTDGTQAGTRMVTDSASLGADDFSFLNGAGGNVYFVAHSVRSGNTQLWTSDGTSKGTVPLIDSASVGYFSFWQFTAVGDRLFFTYTPGSSASTSATVSLWCTDGTQAGTHVVANWYTAYSGVGVGDTLFFAAFDPATQLGMFMKSDGTPAGTGRVTDTEFGDPPDVVPPHFMTATSGSVFLVGTPIIIHTIGGVPATKVVAEPTAVPLSSTATGAFAINSQHELFERTTSGWIALGQGIQSISAVTPSHAAPGTANDPVVFAVTMDGALFRYGSSSGWQQIGAPGTVLSASAGADAAGEASVYVRTTAGDFTGWSPSGGWLAAPIGHDGSVVSMAAGAAGRVAVITADQSIFEFDPRVGWFRLAGTKFASSLSLSTDTNGREVLFAQTVGGGMVEHDFAGGWQRVGGEGTVREASAGLDAAGHPVVYVVTTTGELSAFDAVSGWSVMHPPSQVSGLAATSGGQLFFTLSDGSIAEWNGSANLFALSAAGFAHA